VLKITILAGAPQDTRKGRLFRLTSKWRSTVVAPLLRAWRDTELYGYVCEIRNYCHRIALRRRHVVTRQGHRMDSMLHKCSKDVACIETHARITDIQKLLRLRPLSTILDAGLFSAGWELGADRENSDLLEPGSGKPSLQWRVYVPAASSNSSPKQP
jgi:hypothetical protein